jgi:hypothetical protein
MRHDNIMLQCELRANAMTFDMFTRSIDVNLGRNYMYASSLRITFGISLQLRHIEKFARLQISKCKNLA